MTPAERANLFDALLEGSITEADCLKLEAELIVDPKVRQEYYDRVQLDWMLEQELNTPQAAAATNASTTAQTSRDEAASPSATLKRFFYGRSLLAGVAIGLAASLLLATLVGPWNFDSDSPMEPNSNALHLEPSATGFAILNGQAEAVWGSRPTDIGGLLPTGEMHLLSGNINLELFSGVQLVIEGEARFSIDSPMQVTMYNGRVRAQVPEPAQGFTIKTDAGNIVDLGTEFAVAVGGHGANVEVLDGEIEVRPNHGDVQRLELGQSIRMHESGLDKSTDGPIALMSPREFQERRDDFQAEQFSRWQAATQRLRSDPRLIAYYQFAPLPDQSRQLPNLATSANARATAGAIVAAEPTADRWGRNLTALDFSRLGSRVRIAVSGEYRGLSMMCWVKINSLDRWYNSLMLTDGHEDREPHWQIMDDGRIFFSVKLSADEASGIPTKQREFYSPKVWDASLSGRWLMLAVTYDVQSQTVTHFFNGKPVSQESISDQDLISAIRIGSASIGNWSDPLYRKDARFVLRNLNGSMDEFAIFAGALSVEEMEVLFREGNPYAH